MRQGDSHAGHSMEKILTTTAEYGFEAWHQFTCQKFSASECWQASDSSFQARVSSRQLGALVLSEVSSSALDGV